MLTKYLSVFLISMVPLIELRGAIPVGVAMGLPLWQVYVIAIIGNMLPVPFIFFFARKVLEWGADKPVIGKFFTFCLEKGHKGGAKLKATAGRGLPWALLLFVGIPLPGTGAWTGTLAASLLDMDFKSSVLAVMLGVILAGLIPFFKTEGKEAPDHRFILAPLQNLAGEEIDKRYWKHVSDNGNNVRRNQRNSETYSIWDRASQLNQRYHRNKKND